MLAMKTLMRSVLVALCCALPAGLALAEDAAPAPPQAPAPETPATAAEVKPDAEHQPKVFSMKIGGDAKDGEQGHGITITVDDDEEEVKIAGKVVDRVVGDLETALADLPEEVRAELDADDVEDLRRALQDVRRLKQGESGAADDGDDFAEELIPGVVAIVLLFGGPIVIVAIVSYNNRRKRQMVHQTIDKIIEQGREVPVELLDALDKGQNGKSRLARGTVNVALGLGLGAMLLATAGPEVASIGLIPLCIGLAHLLVWKLERTPEDRTVTG
jgi:hypothetical protein